MEESPRYLDRRLKTQGKWHNDKAQWNKKRFYVFEVTTLLAGAAIPFINVASGIPVSWQRILSALLATIVVISVGVAKLYKFQENWLNYRALSESLKREEELYLNRVGAYSVSDDQERDKVLVERVESILANATSQYIARHKSEGKEPPTHTGADQKQAGGHAA
ncbi:MAG TPA: DUF4231 domain-containing protein [Pyrinomonadaceae bacterium]|jgi:hypothetical protein